MTKGDYKFIAETIKRMKLPPLNKIFLAEHMADDFEKQDKKFQREVFLEHCGVL